MYFLPAYSITISGLISLVSQNRLPGCPFTFSPGTCLSARLNILFNCLIDTIAGGLGRVTTEVFFPMGMIHFDMASENNFPAEGGKIFSLKN